MFQWLDWLVAALYILRPEQRGSRALCTAEEAPRYFLNMFIASCLLFFNYNIFFQMYKGYLHRPYENESRLPLYIVDILSVILLIVLVRRKYPDKKVIELGNKYQHSISKLWARGVLVLLLFFWAILMFLLLIGTVIFSYE